VDEPALLAAAARHGVASRAYRCTTTPVTARKAVLGHAHLAEPAIERGVRLLTDALGAIIRADPV